MKIFFCFFCQPLILKILHLCYIVVSKIKISLHPLKNYGRELMFVRNKESVSFIMNEIVLETDKIELRNSLKVEELLRLGDLSI